MIRKRRWILRLEYSQNEKETRRTGRENSSVAIIGRSKSFLCATCKKVIHPPSSRPEIRPSCQFPLQIHPTGNITSLVHGCFVQTSYSFPCSPIFPFSKNSFFLPPFLKTLLLFLAFPLSAN